jgi:hypothetical protein
MILGLLGIPRYISIKGAGLLRTGLDPNPRDERRESDWLVEQGEDGLGLTGRGRLPLL